MPLWVAVAEQSREQNKESDGQLVWQGRSYVGYCCDRLVLIGINGIELKEDLPLEPCPGIMWPISHRHSVTLPSSFEVNASLGVPLKPSLGRLSLSSPPLARPWHTPFRKSQPKAIQPPTSHLFSHNAWGWGAETGLMWPFYKSRIDWLLEYYMYI